MHMPECAASLRQIKVHCRLQIRVNRWLRKSARMHAGVQADLELLFLYLTQYPGMFRQVPYDWDLGHPAVAFVYGSLSFVQPCKSLCQLGGAFSEAAPACMASLKQMDPTSHAWCCMCMHAVPDASNDASKTETHHLTEMQVLSKAVGNFAPSTYDKLANTAGHHRWHLL